MGGGEKVKSDRPGGTSPGRQQGSIEPTAIWRTGARSKRREGGKKFAVSTFQLKDNKKKKKLLLPQA